MMLDVNGKGVSSPTEDDIAKAIDGREGEKVWYLTLSRPDGFYLEISPSRKGTSDMLDLANGNKMQKLHHPAPLPIDPTQAEAILFDFLHGGTAWRAQWASSGARATRDVLTGRETFSSKTLAWCGGALLLGCAATYVTGRGSMLVYGIGLALAIMVGTKGMREVKVRRWPSANGTITKSDLQARVAKFQFERATLDNIPDVEYRFTVEGRPYIGTRIDLNTQYLGVNVTEMVARYPVGAVVPVYYNPKNPVDCLLDPYANKGLLGGVLTLAAVICGLAFVAYVESRQVTPWVLQRFPDANVPHAEIAFGIGLLLLVVFVWSSMRRPTRSTAPTVTGKVVAAELEQIALGGDNNVSNIYGMAPQFQPTLEVAYVVGGKHYALRTAVPGGDGALMTRDAAQARLAPYPVGREMTVRYNAKNPAGGLLVGGASASKTTSEPDTPGRQFLSGNVQVMGRGKIFSGSDASATESGNTGVIVAQILIILVAFALGAKALGAF